MRKASYIGLSAVTAAAWLAACSSAPVPEETVGSTEQAIDPIDPNDPEAECDVGRTEELEQFSKKCDTAIGATVPDFDCDEGSEVPETNLSGSYPNQDCDRPNVLNHECDPGSRFQVLKNDGTHMVVAHCRKKGLGANYGDIAVIQYNKKNGNTCFYQALGNLPAKVTAPIKGNGGGNFPWKTPAGTAADNCVRCHDNGPFIRSPYIAQLADDPDAVAKGNVLPGSHDFSWNKTNPYNFVGADFQSWKVYEIKSTGTGAGCTGVCHRMGLSALDGAFSTTRGTSIALGPIATAATQTHKNPHSADSPIWMKPGQTTYNASVEGEALDVAECAKAIAEYGNNPRAPQPPAKCKIAQYGQGDTCRGGPKRVIINGATHADPHDGRVDEEETVSECSTPGECPLAFCYWRTLHGSFWQKTDNSIPIADEKYRGSFLRLYAADGAWKTRYFMDNTPGAPMAAPGGTLECSRFNEIQAIPNPDDCSMQTSKLNDSDGTHYSQSTTIAPAGQFINILSGFIGNVAQTNIATTVKPDFLRVYESGTNALLAQEHVKPSAPLIQGPLTGEAYSTKCNAWSPVYLAKDIYTTSDTQLLSAANAKNGRCYISGITGAWSSTRSNGTVQPYAEIYVGPGKDVRLRVAPTDGSDRVGAYASCVKLK
ncbi:hypothetical protein LZC95_47245 [Pendulispora brunnea]|uniref:Uncharacterized protein n=1 Tax=Pendulispora brunnea TaxID=2905690 RepID=A0ABZ2K5R5_9BACT